jgi:hypothetical protein
MARRFRQDDDRVDAMIASVRPVSPESLNTPEVVRAQHDVAAAIVGMPQQSAPVKRRPWLRAPRHALLVGAVIAGLGGSVAVAASLLNAHTGYYPTKHGVPVNMSGPGEALNSSAPNFCQVAFQVSEDIPFPARYASWRLRADPELRHQASDTGYPVRSSRTGGWTCDHRMAGPVVRGDRVLRMGASLGTGRRRRQQAGRCAGHPSDPERAGLEGREVG